MKRYPLVLLFLLSALSYAAGQARFSEKLSNAAIELTTQDVAYDPSYFSIVYPNGDIPSGKGVCTDVIIRAYRKLGTDLQKEVANQWLEVLRLKDIATQPFNQCSYGDQRLLLIARAMVKHPHLLILDEPCFGLDDMNRQLVLALIEKICAGTVYTKVFVVADKSTAPNLPLAI